MENIILDCDPGIDDALAILLAIKSKNCKLSAITTVVGNTSSEMGARNVIKLLYLLERNWFAIEEPSVAEGSKKPLSGKMDFKGSKQVHGLDGLGNTEDLFEKYKIPYGIKSEHNAMELILSKISTSKEPLTLVATGPLTNIAKVIERDPSIIRKLKKAVIMGGAIEVPGNVTPVAEFNIYSDPEAARTVFLSGLQILLVPLDVTKRYLLTKNDISEIFEIDSPVTNFVTRVLSYYMRNTRIREGFEEDGCFLHDALAIGIAINEDLRETIKTKRYFVDVETKGELSSGQTIADRRRVPEFKEYGAIDICFDIDFPKFTKFLTRTILD